MVLKLRASPEPHLSSSQINWDDLESLVDSPGGSEPAHMPSPPTTWIDHVNMPVYGSTPLEPRVEIVRCTDCKKPIMASAILSHAKICKQSKNGKGKGGSPLSGMKRKSDDDTTVVADPNQPPKKKTKKELAKAAAKPRVKGPAELDKHCCVINDKGVPCSRSITCKVHSMVAKRAVQGRSKTYDELLLDWKRANVPGFVEPVKRETKAERKAKKDKEKEEARLKQLAEGIQPGAKKPKAKTDGTTKKASKKDKTPGTKGDKSVKGKVKTGTNGYPMGTEEDDEDEDIDSETEVAELIKAVRTVRPVTAVPLAKPDHMSNFFIARNEILRNCYDTMSFALSGNTIRAMAMGA